METLFSIDMKRGYIVLFLPDTPTGEQKLIYKILELIGTVVIYVISTTGIPGVFFLMALESACIPIPSEIIMPFSGFLASQGRFSLLSVTLAGTLGNLAGSIPAYYLGKYGGRRLIEKYGKYILISRRDLDLADRWFEKHGDVTIFVCRLLPGIRTFIAFPAGVARMDMLKFSIYTLIGSLPWSFGLALVGYKLGENWEAIRVYFRKFDYLILAALLTAFGLYVYRHVKGEMDEKKKNSS